MTHIYQHFLTLLCFLYLSAGAVSASDPAKQSNGKVQRFAPEQIIMMENRGVLYKTPYAYIPDDGETEYSIDKPLKFRITEVPGFHYLWPSFAPVPLKCSDETPTCSAAPVPGFKPAPKDEEQFVMFAQFIKYFPLDVETKSQRRWFKPGSLERIIENKEYGRDEEQGLEYHKTQDSTLVIYKPLDPAFSHVLLHCYEYWCRLQTAIKEEGWTYRFEFNRHHLPKWREIYKSRQTFLDMYPPVMNSK